MIEKNYLVLLEVEGFIMRYWEMCCSYDTNEQAYDATERQYESAFGKRKYNDYTTFKSVLSRYCKERRKNLPSRSL